MGKYFLDNEVKRITFEDREWVDVKEELTQRGADTIQNAMLQAKAQMQNKPNAEVIIDFGQQPLLEYAIVSWSFLEDGKTTPVTPDNISRLRAKYRNMVISEVDKLYAEARNFSKNSLTAST